jgi:hypothetical protein
LAEHHPPGPPVLFLDLRADAPGWRHADDWAGPTTCVPWAAATQGPSAGVGLFRSTRLWATSAGLFLSTLWNESAGPGQPRNGVDNGRRPTGFLDRPVSDLLFSRMTDHLLARAGVRTFRQLRQRSARTLESAGFTATPLQEVRVKLAEYGLSLAGE